MRDGDDLSQATSANDFVHLTPVVRVTQHMADLKNTPLFLGCFHQINRFLKRVADRLFQQHVVACLQCAQTRNIVHLILGTVEDRIR